MNDRKWIIENQYDIENVYLLCRMFKVYGKEEFKNHVFGAYTSLQAASKAAKNLMTMFDDGCKSELKTPGVFYILEYSIKEINNVFVPIEKGDVRDE